MATFYEALKVKEQIAKDLLKRKDILGVGIGYYNPKKPKDGASIIVYSQKVVAHSTSKSNSKPMPIPKKISAKIKGKQLNVPVRVIKNDSFRPNIETAGTRFSRRIRPVQAGYSVGTVNWSGTGGVVVTNRNQLYLLSNNHVLNKNNSTGYTATLQPGGADGGKVSRDRIGSLNRFVKLRKTNNYIDAALAIPINNKVLSTKYAVIGSLRGHLKSYSVGSKFIKVGRTTGLTGGRVESINTDVKVDYGNYGRLGQIQFKNQTIITSTKPISKPGDSGSVWINYNNRFAAAVNYAGTADGKLSVSYPIHWAMQAFNTSVAASSNRIGNIASTGSENYDSSYTRPDRKSVV